MLKRLTIGSYRGLRNLTMENLGQINIIIGENNSGKTSILEATHRYHDDWLSEVTLRECEMLKRLDEAVGKFIGV